MQPSDVRIDDLVSYKWRGGKEYGKVKGFDTEKFYVQGMEGGRPRHVLYEDVIALHDGLQGINSVIPEESSIECKPVRKPGWLKWVLGGIATFATAFASGIFHHVGYEYWEKLRRRGGTGIGHSDAGS
jgi:hypothetical protein